MPHVIIKRGDERHPVFSTAPVEYPGHCIWSQEEC